MHRNWRSEGRHVVTIGGYTVTLGGALTARKVASGQTIVNFLIAIPQAMSSHLPRVVIQFRTKLEIPLLPGSVPVPIGN